jgi:hypothetical protein
VQTRWLACCCFPSNPPMSPDDIVRQRVLRQTIGCGPFLQNRPPRTPRVNHASSVPRVALVLVTILVLFAGFPYMVVLPYNFRAKVVVRAIEERSLPRFYQRLILRAAGNQRAPNVGTAVVLKRLLGIRLPGHRVLCCSVSANIRTPHRATLCLSVGSCLPPRWPIPMSLGWSTPPNIVKARFFTSWSVLKSRSSQRKSSSATHRFSRPALPVAGRGGGLPDPVASETVPRTPLLPFPQVTAPRSAFQDGLLSRFTTASTLAERIVAAADSFSAVPRVSSK